MNGARGHTIIDGSGQAYDRYSNGRLLRILALLGMGSLP
jgi:hypothetical protein